MLRLTRISKSFAGVRALDQVTLEARAGEVHALMGENGAGKSTLMKILSGLIVPDEGAISIDGEELMMTDPRDAQRRGIAMIHQELSPVPDRTVAENIFLGKEPCYPGTGFVNRGAERRAARALLERLHIDIDVRTRMRDLSLARQQLVEIAKAVSYDPRIIIMDEPTSALAVREAEHLFALIRELATRGAIIIYISHKMDEVFRLADTITVLRDGRTIDSRPARDFTADTLITAMVGRELAARYPKEEILPGRVSLEVSGTGVHFVAREGEILGFAGLMGAGRTELVESLFGLRPFDGGEIRIDGARVLIRKPVDAIGAGMALLTEDRKLQGLNLKGTVKTNTSLASLAGYCYAGGWLRPRMEDQAVDHMLQYTRVKTTGRHQPVSGLSGGNQQKVLLARWLLTGPRILLLDEPTRGVDVGAKAEIYALIGELVRQRKTVIVLSSELPELLGICDRILVMRGGRITASFDRADFSQEAILSAAMNE
ncbi:MAG TPA: sugar ABC transporter ATP-binding protein [Puia sp.]|jgi:inositol transport system ATP-binding protein|nr:sugar ABC transporter ATP-binding protein [Puia sp.]